MERQLDLFNGHKTTVFNTNESTQEEVKEMAKKFMSQEKAILSVFVKSGINWTVSQMHEQLLASSLIKEGTPKVSIGRGFTNLQTSGKIELIKGNLVKGTYGASEHYYKLIKDRDI